MESKCCSICGKTHPMAQFSYGNRENRSYCRICNAAVNQAYAKGGKEAASAFRESQRAMWRSVRK